MHELETQQNEELAAGKLIAYRKERLESALKTLPDGVLVVDENGVATYANDKIGPLIGVPAATLLDRSIHDLSLPAEVAASLARAQGRAASGSHVTHYFPPDDPQRRISFSSHALFAPRDPARRLGTLIVARDTSDALLAARARDEFIAHVAHELKTPLANVAMYSELLLEPDAMSPDQRIEAVNVVHDEAERMATLIDNLLSISRIEAGTFSLAQARVRMHDLLDDCFEKARHNTRARGMKLVLDIPSEIGATDADKDLLRIAVDNLLTNAIKYNRPDGEVILSAREIDDRIEIRVRDTGLGIPHADQPRVFEKFFRSADREAVARGGHGLGLFLVRQIVDLHHGKVSVESEPGKGTEFTLTLRRSAALLKEAA